jgi:murein DD-endopeptidase MepM/ murein hydrolase activator NlpD
VTGASAAAAYFLLRTFWRPAVLAIALSLLTFRPGASNEAEAVIERIYTLPFLDTYIITCPFGCYGGHEGTDYQLGDPDAPGEAVVAAASGAAGLFEQFPIGAGYAIFIDHGNGHKTRYMHFSSRTVTDGEVVRRGALIGHEGNSGTSAYHLHFETRHNATEGDCCSGTAVDPYYSGTYMWILDPPQPCTAGGPWSNWENLGGTLNSGPGVSSWDCGRLDVFALGTDDKLRHKWYTSPTVGGSGWSEGLWENLGAPEGRVLNSDPGAVSWSYGRVDVFARASSGDALWHRWFVRGHGWYNWEKIGGVLNSGPGVSSWEPGRLDVFALGTDDKLRHKWYVQGQGWSGGLWENLGAPSGLTLTSDPGVVSWGYGRIDVFARASDNALWHRWYMRGQGWSNWGKVGGVLNSGPGVSSWAEGRLDVFALGTDDKLRHKWYVSGQGWSQGLWQNLGPDGLTLNSDPDAVSWGYRRIDVFVRGSDNALRHRWY